MDVIYYKIITWITCKSGEKNKALIKNYYKPKSGLLNWFKQNDNI